MGDNDEVSSAVRLLTFGDENARFNPGIFAEDCRRLLWPVLATRTSDSPAVCDLAECMGGNCCIWGGLLGGPGAAGRGYAIYPSAE